MVKKVSILCILLIFLIFHLSGCATVHRQKDFEIQGLRNQIRALETHIQAKDSEINSLRDELSKAQEEKEVALTKEVAKKKFIGEVKSRPTVKHIQIALKNAGYNPGSIDGRMGRQTRDAIKAFQKANNLVADGKVGKQTWGLLKEYLYKKIK